MRLGEDLCDDVSRPRAEGDEMTLGCSAFDELPALF